MLRRRCCHQFSRMPLIAGCTLLYCGNSSHLALIPGPLKAKNRYISCAIATRLSAKTLLCTHADRQGVDISVTVCLCVCFCTVMNISSEDKASSVKFCTAVHRRPRQGISHFCELCSPRTPLLMHGYYITDSRQTLARVM